MSKIKNSTKYQIHHNSLSDALTGIYISSVLLVLLIIFISYFLCVFCKRKRDLKRHNIMKMIVNTSSHKTDYSENVLLNTFKENTNAIDVTENKNFLNVNNRKSSEYLDYLMDSTAAESRKSSLVINNNNNRNHLLNSKVSLILLSSQDNNYAISNGDGIDKDEKKLDILFKKFINTNKLDKETANRLSIKIAKYYADRRKLENFNKSSMHRSKSISSLSMNKLTVDDRHRRVSSEKGSKSVKSKHNNYLSANDDSSRKIQRRWVSEKRSSKPKDDYQSSSFNSFTLVSPFEMDSKKKNKPTTIYELYKSNKLHVASLFDEDK